MVYANGLSLNMSVSPIAPVVGQTVTATGTTVDPAAHHASFLWEGPLQPGGLLGLKALHVNIPVVGGDTSDSFTVDMEGDWFVEANIYNLTDPREIDYCYAYFQVQATRIYVDPPSQTVTVCTNFIVWVNVTIPGSTNGVKFNLTFDPSLLEVIDVRNTSFPPNNIMQYQIDNAIGWVWVNVSGTPISDSGKLANITFHCKGPGTSPLNFTMATDGMGNSITYRYNGTCYQPSPLGGEVLATDAPALLIPWIAIAGVVAAAATVLAVISRRSRLRYGAR
jgi:hypothetical protein